MALPSVGCSLQAGGQVDGEAEVEDKEAAVPQPARAFLNRHPELKADAELAALLRMASKTAVINGIFAKAGLVAILDTNPELLKPILKQPEMNEFIRENAAIYGVFGGAAWPRLVSYPSTDPGQPSNTFLNPTAINLTSMRKVALLFTTTVDGDGPGGPADPPQQDNERSQHFLVKNGYTVANPGIYLGLTTDCNGNAGTDAECGPFAFYQRRTPPGRYKLFVRHNDYQGSASPGSHELNPGIVFVGEPCAPNQVWDGSACQNVICTPGATQACYSGPDGTLGVGICTGGTQTCNATGTDWGECQGEVLPQLENPAAGTCSNGADDDCDGLADTGGDSDCPRPQPAIVGSVEIKVCANSCAADMVAVGGWHDSNNDVYSRAYGPGCTGAITDYNADIAQDFFLCQKVEQRADPVVDYRICATSCGNGYDEDVGGWHAPSSINDVVYDAGCVGTLADQGKDDTPNRVHICAKRGTTADVRVTDARWCVGDSPQGPAYNAQAPDYISRGGFRDEDDLIDRGFLYGLTLYLGNELDDVHPESMLCVKQGL
jgi:hypothetical protein